MYFNLPQCGTAHLSIEQSTFADTAALWEMQGHLMSHTAQHQVQHHWTHRLGVVAARPPGLGLSPLVPKCVVLLAVAVPHHSCTHSR